MTGPATPAPAGPVNRRDFAAADPLALPLDIEHWGDLRGAEWRALPWLLRLGWRLRKLAERLDGRTTYTVHGQLPAECRDADLWDALAYGLAATQQYLADLRRERSVRRGTWMPETPDA